MHTAQPDGSRTSFSYDEVGNRTAMENASVSVTATYDAINRQNSISTNYNV
jgi:YD repeat-containing protein